MKKLVLPTLAVILSTSLLTACSKKELSNLEKANVCDVIKKEQLDPDMFF